MKKRKIKKSVIKKAIILLLVILSIIIVKKTTDIMKYHKTNEYKLKQKGYTIDEIKIIEQHTQDNINYVLNNEYDKEIIDLMNEKYYISKNLEKYINYKKEQSDKSIDKIISLVNVNRNKEFYTDTRKSNIELKELMLVNKYNYLDKSFTPENIINAPLTYAYSNVKTTEQTLEYYKKMYSAAKSDGISLILSSGYRSYDEQQETYDEYAKIKKNNIDTYAARPGHSEHQTGLAFDILTMGVKTTDFDKTDEFKWLQDNSYKYGFILRYPKGKEDITGFDYESWHFRYVGQKAAKTIHDENITFDEYYAYYIDNNSEEKNEVQNR